VNTSLLRDGQTTTMHYDGIGRLTSTTGAIAQSFSYDNFGQTKTHTQNGFTETYIYDTAGLLLSDAQPAGTVTYTYDAYGKRNRMTYPDGFYVTYGYWADDSGWFVRDNASLYILRHEFDNYGRLKAKRLGNGSPYPVQLTPGYDARSRMTSLTTNLSTTAATTAYDVTSTFGYTEADQIDTRAISNANYEMPTPAIGTTSYTINGLNQINTKTSGTPASFDYDLRGNLKSDGSTTTYTYNNNNLLTKATDGTVTTNLTYDAENRLYRLVKTSLPATRFLYDGQDLIAEYNDAGTLLRRYVHGFSVDEPVVAYYGTGTTDAYRHYLVQDERGSVIAVTNHTGDITTADTNTGTNAYDAYGLPDAGNVGRFQYTGQTWLPELQLYYYKARMYSPSLGRFLQTDLIRYGDGMNMYNYVHSDPINGSDPSGLCDPGRASGVIVICGERNPFSAWHYLQDRGGECGILGGANCGPQNMIPPSYTHTDVPSSEETPVILIKGAKTHKYSLTRETLCSAADAFEILKEPGMSAPGAPRAKEGFTPYINLSGNNPISQYVNSSTGTIINTTLPGHTFYPGTVNIQVSPLTNETSVISIVGTGEGNNPILNDAVGVAFFGLVVDAISKECMARSGISPNGY